jgi:hypothetical protein
MTQYKQSICDSKIWKMQKLFMKLYIEIIKCKQTVILDKLKLVVAQNNKSLSFDSNLMIKDRLK